MKYPFLMFLNFEMAVYCTTYRIIKRNFQTKQCEANLMNQNKSSQNWYSKIFCQEIREINASVKKNYKAILE